MDSLGISCKITSSVGSVIVYDAQYWKILFELPIKAPFLSSACKEICKIKDRISYLKMEIK